MSDLLSLHRRNPWSIGAKQALTLVLAHGDHEQSWKRQQHRSVR